MTTHFNIDRHKIGSLVSLQALGSLEPGYDPQKDPWATEGMSLMHVDKCPTMGPNGIPRWDSPYYNDEYKFFSGDTGIVIGNYFDSNEYWRETYDDYGVNLVAERYVVQFARHPESFVVVFHRNLRQINEDKT